MIDLENETPLTLNQARRLPYLQGRNGNHISLCTLHRWRRRGVGGVVLETAKVGGTVLTTTEAVLRFVQRLNSGGGSASEITSPGRRSDITRADDRLDRAGV